MDTSTPAQARVRDELLAWDAERPVVDPDLALELRATLEEGARAVFERYGVPGRPRATVATATVCGCPSRGWTAWSATGCTAQPSRSRSPTTRAIAVGTLSHRAIELDHATPPRHSPGGASSPAHGTRPPPSRATHWRGSSTAWTSMAAAGLRQEVEQLLTEHRDVWPPLPSSLHVAGRAVRPGRAARWPGRAARHARPHLGPGPRRPRPDAAGRPQDRHSAVRSSSARSCASTRCC